jgi:hypothetical protein
MFDLNLEISRRQEKGDILLSNRYRTNDPPTGAIQPL